MARKTHKANGEEWNGGRKAGRMNKRTVEKIEEARLAVEESRGRKLKLGKEVLEEFMHLFAGMAATHQPLPEGMPVPRGRNPNEEKFLAYAKLTVDAAKALADFQSPKFKAIAVVATPGNNPDLGQPLTKGQIDNVVTLNDPAALARVYQQRIKQIK